MRTRFFRYAAGVTPAMSVKMFGIGSPYVSVFRDARGNSLGGVKTY